MSNYSDFFNTQVADANVEAVENAGAPSFEGGGGGSANVTQHSAIGVTQSGTAVATHDADTTSSRIVQVLEFQDGSTGITNTDLDFDLADEGDFIQEDAGSGTDFVDGTVRLHENISPGYPTVSYDGLNGGITFQTNNKLISTGGSTWRTALSLQGLSYGKHYYEVTVTVASHNIIGLGTIAGRDINTFPQPGAGKHTTIHMAPTRSEIYGGGDGGSVSLANIGYAWPAGTVLGVAVDADAGKVWFARNNVWILSGDPVNGLNPIGSNVITGETLHPHVSHTDSTARLTTNFGATDFVYDPPSGFDKIHENVSSYTVTDAGLAPDSQLVISADGDASSNNHEITHNGVVKYVSKAPMGDTVVDFQGSYYLTVPTDPMWAFGSSDFTIECWINFSNWKDQSNIVSYYSDSDNRWAFYMGSAGEGVRFYYRASGAWEVFPFDGSTAWSNDGWDHVAVVRNGSDIDIYINGVSKGNSTYGGSFSDFSAPLQIGAVNNTPYTEGAICGLRLSDTARYTTTFDPPTATFADDVNTLFLLEQGTEGSNTFTDYSSNAHTITPSSASLKHELLVPAGNGVVDFTASNSYMSVPSSITIGTGDFTIEGWIKPRSVQSGSYRYLYAFGNTTQDDLYFYIEPTDVLRSSNKFPNLLSTSIDLDKWSHFAFVRESGFGNFYLNGVPIGSPVANTVDYGVKPVNIGSNHTPDMYLNGFIAQFRVSDTARYTVDFSGNLPTVSHTDDPNTLLLIHGDGVTKSLYNLTTSGDPELKAGKFEEAFYFDGVGDYISVAGDLNLGANDFTIDFWFLSPELPLNTSGNDGNDGIFGYDTTLPTEMYANIFYDRLDINIKGTIKSLQPVIVSTWYHVAIVRSGNTAKAYVNGVNISGAGWDLTGETFETNDFVLGMVSGATNRFNGYIDEFRISNMALWTTDFTPPNAAHSTVDNPTDGSAYVTTSDSNQLNVSALAIDSFNSCTITNTTPAGTTLKALVSFDGRTTWSKYDGSFTTVSGMNFTGATVSGLEAGFSGLTASGIETLDFAFELDTTDSSATPSVDLITLNYDELGTYDLSNSNDYTINHLSSTSTEITKNSVGSKNIKVNIIL